MSTVTTPDADMERAKRLWAEYQQAHDVAALEGQTVAVDLEAAQILTGPSAHAIRKQYSRVGVRRPLMVVRPNGVDLRQLERLRGSRWQRVT